MPRIRIKLEKCLKRANMSGRELARRVGCSKDTIVLYRSGRIRHVDLDLLERFCTILDCQLTDLLTDQAEHAAPRPGVTPPQGVLSPKVCSSPVHLPTWPDGTPTHPIHAWSAKDLSEFGEAWFKAWQACKEGTGPDRIPLGPDGDAFPALSQWTAATFDRFTHVWEWAWLRAGRRSLR